MSPALPSLRLAPVLPEDAFLGVAEALLQGVQPLAAALPNTAWPLTFLAGQTVECALKAYLAGRGRPEVALRRTTLRHDLIRLWALARAEGLSYASDQPTWLQRLGELHGGQYVLRYPMGLNGIVLPQCEALARDLPLLVAAVREGTTRSPGTDLQTNRVKPSDGAT
jgi:hypothetical protein